MSVLQSKHFTQTVINSMNESRGRMPKSKARPRDIPPLVSKMTIKHFRGGRKFTFDTKG